MSDKVKIRLQGHEKFILREGWLNKGLNIVPSCPDAFLRKDSPDMFGIGSNMVKSLRYWMKALGLISEKPQTGAVLTDFGKLVMKYDEYIEKRETLWLVHSYIAKNIAEATAWYMFFNRCDVDGLDKDQIESVILREIKSYSGDATFSEKSVGNDIDVLLNMYSKKKDDSDPEEKNVSPFAQLELVKCHDGKYIKNHPNKKSISEYIVLYEIAQIAEGRSNISIEEVIFGEKGLSKIYNITPVLANDMFDKLDALGYLRVDRTAGLDMIYFPDTLKLDRIVELIYRNN